MRYPITLARDGYITCDTPDYTYKTVEYDTDTLRYACNLDSGYTYTLGLTYYREGQSSRSYEVLVDEELSSSAVQDGKITVEIRPISGDTVTCGDFLIFQCKQQGGGGGQAFKRRTALPLRPMLKAPRPNPSLNRVQFYPRAPILVPLRGKTEECRPSS